MAVTGPVWTVIGCWQNIQYLSLPAGLLRSFVCLGRLQLKSASFRAWFETPALGTDVRWSRSQMQGLGDLRASEGTETIDTFVCPAHEQNPWSINIPELNKYKQMRKRDRTNKTGHSERCSYACQISSAHDAGESWHLQHLIIYISHLKSKALNPDRNLSRISFSDRKRVIWERTTFI